MNDSERYIQPPPPYEHSLQHDRKITEAQAPDSEVLKRGPFPDGEKDQGSDKDLKDALPGVTKYLPRQTNGNLRALRPLPPRPMDSDPRGKLEPVAETKSFAAQNDYATEPEAPPLPLFSAIGHTLDDASYMQGLHHPGPAVHHSSFPYPSQSSFDAPRRESDDRWRVSTYPVTESYAEAPFKRSSHPSFQSPSYSLPSNGNSGARLLFDPSVAYSDSQAIARTATAAQRAMAVSLYSSAVSPHLRPSSTATSGPHQYVPSRPASWSTQTLRPDKARPLTARAQPLPPIFSSPTSPPAPRLRTQSGYEQRWATSESDITRDVYRG